MKEALNQRQENLKLAQVGKNYDTSRAKVMQYAEWRENKLRRERFEEASSYRRSAHKRDGEKKRQRRKAELKQIEKNLSKEKKKKKNNPSDSNCLLSTNQPEGSTRATASGEPSKVLEEEREMIKTSPKPKKEVGLDSSDSPVSDYEDQYSSDDLRPITSNNRENIPAIDLDLDTDEENRPKAWSACCQVGIRIFGHEGVKLEVHDRL